MPVRYFNATDIAHDDQRMEDQLLQEVSRNFTSMRIKYNI